MLVKTILLFGAGKSSACCIKYLGEHSLNKEFHFIVADADVEVARIKTAAFPQIETLGIDITDAEVRIDLIKKADVVISMLPPSLHILVATDCVQASVHLLTASYLDDHMKALEPEIKTKNLLFICELGLDPGIDHMSAMSLIEQIRKDGGEITSFKSHCGGLIAPESDDNPWHYKISWNPRNVVNAGKQGAIYLQDGQLVTKDYDQLFDVDQKVLIPGEHEQTWGYYANRDSLSYTATYGLEHASDFIRTTLRHPAFITGWEKIVEFELTNEDKIYDSNILSVQQVLKLHLQKNEKAELYNDAVRQNDQLSKQLNFLQLHIDETKLNYGLCSICDVLQYAMENKLALRPDDKDMIVMMHEIVYKKETQPHLLKSALVVKGEDNMYTAMAKTVGLPLAITAELIIQNKLDLTGLHIPASKEIYRPVLKKLASEGIIFKEFSL